MTLQKKIKTKRIATPHFIFPFVNGFFVWKSSEYTLLKPSVINIKGIRGVQKINGKAKSMYLFIFRLVDSRISRLQKRCNQQFVKAWTPIGSILHLTRWYPELFQLFRFDEKCRFPRARHNALLAFLLRSDYGCTSQH